MDVHMHGIFHMCRRKLPRGPSSPGTVTVCVGREPGAVGHTPRAGRCAECWPGVTACEPRQQTRREVRWPEVSRPKRVQAALGLMPWAACLRGCSRNRGTEGPGTTSCHYDADDILQELNSYSHPLA